ncbi:phage tail protein [Acinetobacter ursingii]|uniref:TipJ family phage tail tip protein n=1 Tax=Acinetobacter ursingii TaxID=108980 RepID=UPI0021E29B95|nr:phage tail protein [Acinetobacter ursingii]UYF78230.1 phage tail protein [Acinetobacter ursingii]
MDKKIIGAKKQANQSRAPVIAPDSAQSTTTVKILYGLSEGEIEGLADGLKSIYLDDTPVHDTNDNPNFDNVIVDFRAGTNDQDYIEGFPDVSNEININVELKETTPWVRAFSNTDLDAARVRLKWGALRVQDATTGNVDGITIRYAIDRQTDGGVWEEVINTQISDKTSPDYQRTHRIELPRADNGWQIRVRRITPNQNSDLVSDKMYVAAVTEVIDVKLRYPNTALLGLQYDAETFSNIAKMAARCKGVRIRVPTNYDSETRQYVGIWDGTFKYAYTNNPAWHFYDACIDKRRGLGNHLDQTMVDKWSIYRLGQYCDELVPDGKGDQEPRFTLNVYQQSQEDAYSVLGKMAGVMRAYMFWDGQSIVLDADMPSDTVYTFTRANVINGHFEFSGTRKRDRHTIAVVNFDNPDNRFKTEQEPIPDEEAIAKYGINKVEIDAWGVTSRGQAQRAGQWALKTEKYETQTVVFKVGLEGYIPQPGKVIEIADESFAGRANGGRIAAISADLKQITLDRDNVVCQAGDRLVVNGEDGKSKARVIQSISERVVTVVSAFEENTVSAQNVWVIDAQDLTTMKFRIVSIIQNDKHQFEIKAVQYNPQKYDAIDYGAYIDQIPITIVNPDMQPAVESVSLSTYDKFEQGMNIAVMVIAWNQTQGAVRYQVEWRKDDGSWIKMPLTGNNSVEVEGIYSGNYQARITAFSAFDIASLPRYSSVTALLGKNGTPPALANLTATGILFGIQLDWVFPAKGALDTAHTEIRVSPDGVSNISTLGLFAYPTTTHALQGLQPNLKLYFQARLIDRLGNVGPWSDWVNATTSADASAVLNILSGKITETQLHHDLQQKIDKIDVIEGDLTVYDQRIQDAKNTADQANQNLAVERQQRIDDVGKLADNIASESQARISAVQNLSDGLTHESQQRVAGDEHVLSVVDTYKQSTENSFAAVRQEIEVVADDVSAVSTKLDGVYAKVTPLTADQDNWTADSGSNQASSWSIQSAQVDGDSALGQRIDTINVQVGSNQAAIQEERSARASGDEANTQAINNYIARNDTALASVKQTAESAVSASSSNSSAIQALDNRVDVAEADASVAKTNAASAITKAETAVSTAGSASSLAQQASATATAASDTASTANSNASNAVNTANTANNTANEAKTNAASALSTANAAASESSANASQINSINAALGDKASTGALNSVKAEVDEIDGRLTAATEKVDGVYAKVTPLTADQDNWTADSGSNQASSWSIQSAQVDGDSALSQRMDIVSTTVGENTATIKETTESVNGLYAQKFTKIDVNGKVIGWGGANDGVEGIFVFNVDSLAIGSGNSTGYYPFIFRTTPFTDPVTGTVFPVSAYLKSAMMDYQSVKTSHIEDLAVKTAKIDNLAVKTAKIDDLAVTGAKIDNLAVDTLKIKDNAVTVPVSAFAEASTSVGGDYTTVQTLAVPADMGHTILTFGSVFSFKSYTSQQRLLCRVLKNGNVVFEDLEVHFIDYASVGTTTQNSGQHQHAVSVSISGTASDSGSHNHSFSGSTANSSAGSVSNSNHAHNYSGSTSTAGSHSHSLNLSSSASMGQDGIHSHSVEIRGSARSAGTLNISRHDSTLIAGTFELQLRSDSGGNVNVSQRYIHAMTMRK